MMGIYIRQQKDDWFVTVDETWKLDSNVQFKEFYDFASKNFMSFETQFGMEIIFVKMKKCEIKKKDCDAVINFVSELLRWKKLCGDVL
jgi:hypothetical protein